METMSKRSGETDTNIAGVCLQICKRFRNWIIKLINNLSQVIGNEFKSIFRYIWLQIGTFEHRRNSDNKILIEFRLIDVKKIKNQNVNLEEKKSLSEFGWAVEDRASMAWWSLWDELLCCGNTEYSYFSRAAILLELNPPTAS